MKIRFRERLLARGYKDSFLSQIFPQVAHSDRFNWIPQFSTQNPNPNPKNPKPKRLIFPLVLQYNRQPSMLCLLPKIQGWNLKLGSIFTQESKLLWAFKKSRNILDLTTKVNLTENQRKYLFNMLESYGIDKKILYRKFTSQPPLK